jgi:hypothetical protein
MNGQARRDRPTLFIPVAFVLTEDGVERVPVVMDLQFADDLAQSSEALQRALARDDCERKHDVDES